MKRVKTLNMSNQKDILVAKMYGFSNDDWPKLKCLLNTIPMLEEMNRIKEKLRVSMFANLELNIGTDIIVKATFIQDVHQFIGFQRNGDRYTLYKNCCKYIRTMKLIKLKKFPQVGENVLVKYESEVCRAVVLNRMDPGTVKIYFIDYGLCRKTKICGLFEYDQTLNEYPPFAIRFRIHGIRPCKPNDIDAIQGMQRVLLAQKISAKIVGINQINANEIEIEADVWDVNGSNIAITFIERKLAQIC